MSISRKRITKRTILSRKNFIFLLLLLSLMVITIPKIFLSSRIAINKNEDQVLPLKTSNYQVLHELIVIDELGPFTWADAVATSWCSGSGSINDPYIIENIIIDANQTGSCITISNSLAHFIVKNCTLTNSSIDVLRIYNSSNGQFIDNTISNNKFGIYMNLSNNTIISGNSISEIDYDGVYMDTCDDNIISGNNMKNNTYNGIYLVNCDNNNISRNFASKNGDNGICLYRSNDNSVSENMVDNSISSGIRLYYSNNNIISLNALHNNSIHGIDLIFDSNNNSIWLNSFVNNSVKNANDEGNDNLWDNGSYGNFWDDYTGLLYANGTGMEPYNISESPLIQDMHPIGDSIPILEFEASETLIVSNQSISFFYTGIGGNLPLRFEWDFGDESPRSNEKNPTHCYSISGNYSVNLTVIDATADFVWISKTNYIVVEEDTTPILEFPESEIYVDKGYQIQLFCDVSGGNAPLKYSWDFGDDSSLSNEMNPIHTYEDSGNYVVTLTVIDRDGDMTIRTTNVLVSSNSESDDTSTEQDFNPAIIVFSACLFLGIITISGTAITLRTRIKKTHLSPINYPSQGLKQNKLKGPKKLDNNSLNPSTSHLIFEGSISNKNQDKKSLENTESEFRIRREEFLCVVHKGAVEGANIYMCPHCKAFYCKPCASALKERNEGCWACGKALEL